VAFVDNPETNLFYGTETLAEFFNILRERNMKPVPA
jgi:hypothetical protein